MTADWNEGRILKLSIYMHYQYDIHWILITSLNLLEKIKPLPLFHCVPCNVNPTYLQGTLKRKKGEKRKSLSKTKSITTYFNCVTRFHLRYKKKNFRITSSEKTPLINLNYCITYCTTKRQINYYFRRLLTWILTASIPSNITMNWKTSVHNTAFIPP